jgi:hypothetical protein
LYQVEVLPYSLVLLNSTATDDHGKGPSQWRQQGLDYNYHQLGDRRFIRLMAHRFPGGILLEATRECE